MRKNPDCSANVEVFDEHCRLGTPQQLQIQRSAQSVEEQVTKTRKKMNLKLTKFDKILLFDRF